MFGVIYQIEIALPFAEVAAAVEVGWAELERWAVGSLCFDQPCEEGSQVGRGSVEGVLECDASCSWVCAMLVEVVVASWATVWVSSRTAVLVLVVWAFTFWANWLRCAVNWWRID